MTHLIDVTCPYCFQEFGVACPPPQELPSDVDYDCEICCRPLRIAFEQDEIDDEPTATAYSLAE